MRIEVGRNVKGGGVYLTPKEFESHLHVIGLTRSGKSMWLLDLVLKLLKLGKSLIVIDPHWKLVNFILNYLVCHSIGRPVTVFDPSYEKRIVGFNPFQTPYTDEARKMTKAERLSPQLMHVFGMENTDQYGNIEKYLRAIFFTILDRNLSIADLDCFLHWSLKDKRRPIIEAVSSLEIKAELKDLYSSKTEFDRKIGSTKNKLQRFTHRQMKKIMGLRENNIDLDALIENKGILLCNFQPSETDLVGRENMRALGTLLISELWESFRKRTKPQEFYLVVSTRAKLS
jgi:type IV secretory system conjugative DNA transfer VirD4/TraG family protein